MTMTLKTQYDSAISPPRRLRDPEAWGARVIDSIMAAAG